MSKSIIYSNKDGAYLSKKHFCPKCNVELKKVKVTKKLIGVLTNSKKCQKCFREL